jgi:hypothetical protein
MRTILATLTAIGFTALSLFAAEIKSTTKLSISPYGADFPIREITDVRMLSLSNVFAGKFIGALTDAPRLSLPRYTISFDIQARDGVKTAGYVVQYCVDATTGEAFVYLPGNGEPAYRRNISAILRQGHDGRWHHASAEWRTAIQPYLP